MMGIRGLLLLVTSGVMAAATSIGLGPGAGEVMGSGDGLPASRTEAVAASASAPAIPQTPSPYQRVLSSVRGMDDLACGLVQRALGNRWGSGSVRPVVDVPDGADTSGQAMLDRVLDGRPGADALEGLLRGLEDGDRCVRNVAAVFLGWMKDPSPVGALERRVAGAAPSAVPAIRALGHGEWPEGLPPLLDALDRPETEVRVAAAWALGQYERASTVEDLVRLLTDTDVSVRRTALWALGRIERSSAVPAILPHLDDPEASVRLNAVWALGRIESSAAIPALVARLAADSDPDVRNAIAWALGQID